MVMELYVFALKVEEKHKGWMVTIIVRAKIFWLSVWRQHMFNKNFQWMLIDFWISYQTHSLFLGIQSFQCSCFFWSLILAIIPLAAFKVGKLAQQKCINNFYLSKLLLYVMGKKLLLMTSYESNLQNMIVIELTNHMFSCFLN